VYAACKGGIIAFTKTLARELAAQHINLNVVCPGPTDTPLLQSFAGEGEQGLKVYEALKRAIPFRRLGQPDRRHRCLSGERRSVLHHRAGH
jgi:2-hydroxycyclohexanecarboxyl-CoA dehydrogenase